MKPLPLLFVLVVALAGRAAGEPARITLDEAIALALQHNHALLAARTAIGQSEAQEVTAGLIPNPGLSVSWQPPPLGKPSQGDSVLGAGLSQTFELGKRGARVAAARDATTVARSQVADNERAVAFQAASLFINVQLAESTLEVARQNLESFEKAVGISESSYRTGSVSENDFLKLKVQLLQFQTDVEQALLSKAQALSDLRQALGYESVPPDYDVAGPFDYRPVQAGADRLLELASQARPDLRAAQQGVAAAESQLQLAKVNARPDVTVSAGLANGGGLNVATFGVSIPLPIFDRNQGEIARNEHATIQAREQYAAVVGQVKTDVTDAFEALQTSERVAQHYLSGYLDVARKSRDISEYAWRRGATNLLDFLDAERSYRATQLGWRQAIAAHLLALEQVRQAVGTRNLP